MTGLVSRSALTHQLINHQLFHKFTRGGDSFPAVHLHTWKLKILDGLSFHAKSPRIALSSHPSKLFLIYVQPRLKPPRRAAPSAPVHASPGCLVSADRPATPPATQYILRDTFDQIVARGIKSKTKSFLSSTQRFHGGLFEVKGVGDDPGPGAYNVDVVKVAAPPPRSRTKRTSRLPQCARFSARTEAKNSLGPGSHEIAGSLIKKTFNITFGGASVPAGAGRVAHRVYQARKQGSISQMAVGAPATQESMEPANVCSSSPSIRETDIL